MERDKNNVINLEQMDWRVFVIWECETKKGSITSLSERIKTFLSPLFR